MPVELQDPAADVRAAIALKSGVPELPNKVWFHKTAAAVIDANRCVRCGTCIAACPSQSIAVAEDGLPTLVRMCTGCSCCWDFCPLAGLRTERLWKLQGSDGTGLDGLGSVRAAHSARAQEPAPGAQDGGVVTAVLSELLSSGAVDGVLVTRRSGPLRGQAAIARTVAEVRASAGSIYEQTLPLALLGALRVDQGTRLAMVGTPCQINGLRALQRYGWGERQAVADAVKVTIGLFCTRSFDGHKLTVQLLSTGIDVLKVSKVNVSEGILSVYGEDGQVLLARPVKEFWGAALRGCDECADFSALLADLAVGNVGSPPGSSTVLVRTAAGEAAWQRAQHSLISAEIKDMGAVAQLERRNRRRATKSLKRTFDPDGPLWISYADHLLKYTGTDREPVAPPPHRSHHYTTAC